MAIHEKEFRGHGLDASFALGNAGGFDLRDLLRKNKAWAHSKACDTDKVGI